MCVNLLDNHLKYIFLVHGTIHWLKCVVHHLNLKKTENWLRKLMHNFVVHSNDSMYINIGLLGLEQVFWHNLIVKLHLGWLYSITKYFLPGIIPNTQIVLFPWKHTVSSVGLRNPIWVKFQTILAYENQLITCP